MKRSESAIFTVLCLVYDDNGNILVEDRVGKSWTGVALPGGHVEPGEAFTDAAVREVLEETGLSIEAPVLCGVKQFQQDEDTRYVVFLYKTNRFSGQLRSSSEGNVFWVNKTDLPQYRLVDDFEALLRVFECEDLNEFIYRKNGSQWNYELL